MIAENHLHAIVLQMLLNGKIQILGLLGAQMADGAIHQLQAGLDGPLADLLDLFRVAKALHMLIRAELQVDFVRVVDGLLGQILTDQAGQVAAHLIAQGQLAVGKRTGTGKARGDMAIGLAVNALFGLALGAMTLLHRLALFHQHNLLSAALFQHLQGRKNTGRAGSNNYYIRLHTVSSIAQKNTRRAVSPPGNPILVYPIDYTILSNREQEKF